MRGRPGQRQEATIKACRAGDQEKGREDTRKRKQTSRKRERTRQHMKEQRRRITVRISFFVGTLSDIATPPLFCWRILNLVSKKVRVGTSRNSCWCGLRTSAAPTRRRQEASSAERGTASPADEKVLVADEERVARAGSQAAWHQALEGGEILSCGAKRLRATRGR